MKTTIQSILHEELVKMEQILQSDIFVYYGPIDPSVKRHLKEMIEDIASENKYNQISIILTSPGGSVEATEDFVNILRHHYDIVNFIIPDYAMSAGTIFAMSGDEIYMDYASALGPIDPQILGQDGKWVPGLGYLDKINSLLEKEGAGELLTQSEINMIINQDIGRLQLIEQAHHLTVTLLKKWLVQYKFKNWTTHGGNFNLHKKGQPVTSQEKEERAKEIAVLLGDNKHWHSHGRSINQGVLWNELKLTTKNIQDNKDLYLTLKKYYDTLIIVSGGSQIFFQTRNSF